MLRRRGLPKDRRRWTGARFSTQTRTRRRRRVHRFRNEGADYFGKIDGKTTSVVKMRRSLWPHSGTMMALCFAPIVSVMYLKNAAPRARRVGPCAIAPDDES